jgi:hypothetical protein
MLVCLMEPERPVEMALPQTAPNDCPSREAERFAGPWCAGCGAAMQLHTVRTPLGFGSTRSACLQWVGGRN